MDSSAIIHQANSSTNSHLIATCSYRQLRKAANGENEDSKILYHHGELRHQCIMIMIVVEQWRQTERQKCS